MVFKSSAAAAALVSLLAAGLVGSQAHAACVPKTGRRGSFPFHTDSDIPSNSRFLFEIASWPDKPAVSFKVQYGDTDIPGKLGYLYPVGLYPEDKYPHSQYLYSFVPDGGIAGTDLPYHYFLTFRLAGGTKDETASAVFTVKQGSDTTPPDFGGIAELSTIHGTPDQTSMESGYDCILGEGTFVITRVKFPQSEVKQITTMEKRRDGVVFTAYAIDDGGQVGDVMARSIVWPAEYTNTPIDWLFVIEKDPPPDTKRCYVVRATDSVGNEEKNMNFKCITAPGPASLPPGAGAPGFFGDDHTPGVCAFGGARPDPLAAALGLLLVGALLRRRRG